MKTTRAKFAALLATWLLTTTVALAQNWTTAKLSQARSSLAAASNGSKVFFAGGEDAQGGFSDVVDIYDVSTNTWSTARLSSPRGYLAAASAGGKVFFAGGLGNTGLSNVVDIYDMATGTWSTATLSQPRLELAATNAGGKVFFGGGLTTNDAFSDVVDVYDVTGGAWSMLRLPTPRAYLAAVGASDKVYFAGGQASPNQYSATIDIYDVPSGRWSAAQLTVGRANLAATSTGDRLFFAGGESGSTTYFNTVDVYDLNRRRWSVARLSQARTGLAAISNGGMAFFGGGLATVNAVDAASAVADTYEDAWKTAALSKGRAFLAAASANGLAFFAGGEDASGNVTDVVDIYTPDLPPPTFTQQPTPAFLRVCPGANASSTVVASAGKTSAVLTYQWYRDAASTTRGILLEGQTNPTLNLTNVQPADADAYYCRALNGEGEATWSQAFTLALNAGPTAIVSTGGKTVFCPGESIFVVATFGGSTTGGTFSDGGLGGSFQNVSSTSSLVRTTYVPPAGYIGPVTISFVAGPARGQCPPLTVTLALRVAPTTAIQSMTPSQGVCPGTPFTLTVGAVGGALTYAWYQARPGGDVPLLGATGPTLTVTPSGAEGTQETYYVVVRGTCGTTQTSSRTTLTVRPTPSLTLDQSTVFCQNSALRMTANSNAGGQSVFQWKNPQGTVVSNMREVFFYEADYTRDNGTWVVTVQRAEQNACKTTLEVPVTVMNEIPTECTISGPRLYCPQTNSDMKWTATPFTQSPFPPEAFTYQWQLDGVNVGGNNATLYAAGLDLFVNNGYEISVTITSNCGVITGSFTLQQRAGCNNARLAAEVVEGEIAPALAVTPNPATGGELQCRLKGLESPQFGLFGPTGRRLDLRVDSTLEPGRWRLRPVQVLPPGVYVLEATEGSTRLTQRVLVTE